MAGAQTRASDPHSFQPPPFGHGSGPIFWDDVRCTGPELTLEDCPHLSTLKGSMDCTHEEDVGVTCQPLLSPAATTVGKSHNILFNHNYPMCMYSKGESRWFCLSVYLLLSVDVLSSAWKLPDLEI